MGHGTVPEEVVIAQMCRNMHWTYDEYLAQPQWFVELLEGMLRVDLKESERQLKKEKSYARK
jgi:hypothetical protein